MTVRAALEYIVAEYAINECKWLDLEEKEEEKNEIRATRPRYVGWAVLDENETRKRGLFDVQETPQTTGNSNKRSLRSANKI